ncbi:hypothetical protein HHB59_09830 [Neisseria meningitidis]|uniref:hypothetical protein n=1 Tax=Neisseria meningitidis TaxID=487 RepID=UPI0034D4640A|nr:hypothetical protein [Neisseria meningitidis]MBW3918946.1 hypothetical protein [Neisseria meningitidis]
MSGSNTQTDVQTASPVSQKTPFKLKNILKQTVDIDKFKPRILKCCQAKPSQAKPSQAKPSQAKPSQAKPSQAKPSPDLIDTAGANTEAIYTSDGITANSTQLEQLKKLFPACFDADGNFLIDRL